MPTAPYKDCLFRDYFNNPKRLLSLCNALLNTDVTDVNEVRINTLEGLFFAQAKNDLSCLFQNQFLVITEHQSTQNENMPLRCLMYVTELFKKIIEPIKEKLYQPKLINLPTPRFFELYNGNKLEPPRRTLRLSAAFADKSPLELEVELINLNTAVNGEFIEPIVYLRDYCFFVDMAKSKRKAGLSEEQALWETIDYCCAHNIMMDNGYLQEKRAEVFDMFNFEWNQEDAQRAWLNAGREQGLEQGEGRIKQLFSRLLQDGKTDDMARAVADADFCNELYHRYGIA